MVASAAKARRERHESHEGIPRTSRTITHPSAESGRGHPHHAGGDPVSAIDGGRHRQGGSLAGDGAVFFDERRFRARRRFRAAGVRLALAVFKLVVHGCAGAGFVDQVLERTWMKEWRWRLRAGAALI